MKTEIQAVLSFILELEKLKDVTRKIKPPGLTRYENSAEHSWQIALLGLSLIDYAPQPLNPIKVVSMLLLHDIVEIDTGDKFAYSSDHDDYENEHAAAKRIFALLPSSLGQQYLTLWEEFEAALTPEARFAKAVDRLMPVLQNLSNGCQSWLENDISVAQIFEKNAAIEQANPVLWEMIKQQVTEAAKKVGLRDK